MLRLWISFTSLFGFFGAWAMLAQSFKSAPQAQPQLLVTIYPTLTALPPIGINSTVQPSVALQVITPTPSPFPTPQPPPVFFAPVLRTGGS
jgi:hypothetical protein